MSDTTAADDWYNGKPESLAQLVPKLESNLSQERFIDGAITRLYYGQGVLPVGMAASSSPVPLASMFLRALDSLIEENVLASVLDAAVSMIVRKPAIKFITSGAKWRGQITARRLSRLATDAFGTSGLEDETTAVVLDSMRCQVAGVKWSISPKGKARCERCLPHTLIYNPAEGPDPRNIFERHGVPRARLMRECPEHAKMIKELPAYRPDAAFHVDVYTYAMDRDLVEVVEGWRRAEEDDPGRHVMAAGSEILVDDPWMLSMWPIVPLTWGSSYDTLAGYPLGRRVLSFQRTINRMDRFIDEAQTKGCAPKLLVPKGSEVTGWDNAVGSRVDYVAAAGKPEVIPGAALPPEYYNRFYAKKSAAYELAGVAQNIASGTKEAGLNSGKAQRDRYDIANSRLVDDAKRLERWFAANAQVYASMMVAAHEANPEAFRESEDRDRLREIDWDHAKDVLGRARAYITSSIPVEPSGRAETLAEWVQDGVLSQRRAVRWYADPDTASIEDDESAMEDLIMRMIESSLADGVYMPPEPVMGPEGLTLLAQLAGQELMKALTMPEAPPEGHVELLRRLIEEAKLLLTQPTAPGQTGAPAPQLAPAPGVPAAGPAPQAPVFNPGLPQATAGGPPLPAPAPPQ